MEPKCPWALGPLYSDRGMEAIMEDSSHWLQSSVSLGVQLLGRVSEAPTFLEKSFPRCSTPQTLDSRGTFPNLWNQESGVPAPQLSSLTSRGPLLSSTLAPFLLVPQFPGPSQLLLQGNLSEELLSFLALKLQLVQSSCPKLIQPGP